MLIRVPTHALCLTDHPRTKCFKRPKPQLSRSLSEKEFFVKQSHRARAEHEPFSENSLALGSKVVLDLMTDFWKQNYVDTQSRAIRQRWNLNLLSAFFLENHFFRHFNLALKYLNVVLLFPELELRSLRKVHRRLVGHRLAIAKDRKTSASQIQRRLNLHIFWRNYKRLLLLLRSYFEAKVSETIDVRMIEGHVAKWVFKIVDHFKFIVVFGCRELRCQEA